MAREASALTDPTDRSDRARYALYALWLEHPNSTIRANSLICLIHQANYLLDHQVSALEWSIIEEGGYRENLTAARLARGEQCPEASSPSCPQCGKPMAQRTARKGKNAGNKFWGCTAYPDCKSTRPFRPDRSDRSV